MCLNASEVPANRLQVNQAINIKHPAKEICITASRCIKAATIAPMVKNYTIIVQWGSLWIFC